MSDGQFRLVKLTDSPVSFDGPPAYYSSIYAHQNSTQQNGVNDDGTTEYKIENFTADGPSVGFTPDFANNKITVIHAGTYEIAANISIMASGNPRIYFGVQKNDVYIDGLTEVFVLTDVGINTGGKAAGVSGLVALDVGDVLTLAMTPLSNSGSTDFLFDYLNLNIRSIGGQGLPGATGATGATGAAGAPGADGVVQSVVAGTNVTVNNTDPANPIVNASGTGGGVDEAFVIAMAIALG